MFRYKFIILFATIVLLGSCKKELPFPDVNANKKLVVNGAIKVGGPVQVHLSDNCHINEQNCNEKFVTDANVVLKDSNQNTLGSLTDIGNGIYSSVNIDLTENSTFFLEVNRANSTEIVKSRAHIPTSFECQWSDELGIRTFEGRPNWSFEVEIEDNPNEENYYILSGYFEFDDCPRGGSENEIGGIIEPHTRHYSNDLNAENKSIYQATDIVDYGLKAVYLPDENFNGQNYKIEFAVGDDDLGFCSHVPITAMLTVKSVSKELYDHHVSLERYLLNQGNIFAEPSSISGNIENGIGIFGAYAEQTYSIALPEVDVVPPSQMFADVTNCSAACTVNLSTDGSGDALSFFWDFGDGNTSTEPNPTHTYTEPGVYNPFVEVSYVLHFGGTNEWFSDGPTITVN